MENLDGNPSAELGVNDLIRDLNRLTFLNDLAADRAQSEPNIFESILLSTLRSIDALLFNIKNLASIPKLVAFSFVEMMTFHKNVVIANISNKVIALGNTYAKVSTILIRNKVIFVIPKLVASSFVEMMTFHKNTSVTNFNNAVMAITGAYNETLTTLNRNKVLFTIPKLVAFSFLEMMTFHKNVVIAELTHGINSIHAYLTKTSGYVSRYIYSIKNSVSSLEINLPTNSFKLAILRPALSVGLVITLISSLSGVSAIADELNGDETVSVSSEQTPAPEVTPTPEPTVGDEVIVEETPAIAAEDVVTETPTPEPSVACVTEIALNEDGTPVDPTQVLCEKSAPIVVEAPTNLNYQVLVEGIKLTWDKSVSSVDKYVVNVGPDNRNIDVSADTAELLLTDLNRKSAYSFTVTAISGELQSAVLGPLNLDLAIIKFPRPPMNAEVGGLIVKFNNDLSSSEITALADNGDLVPVELEVSKEISTDTRLVEFNEPVNVTTAQEIADSLEASNSVEFAELDFAFNTASSDELGSVVPNDPLYASKQWSLWGNFGIGVANGPTGLALAYQNSTGLGVTVAVIDTGFTNHPDLEGQFVSGYDFVSNNEMLSGIREENGTAVPYDGDYIDNNTYGPIGWDDNPQDPGDWKNGTNSSWHGTHVAGLISALTNNGIGIAGIAPDAKIQPIRAFSWRGGLLSDVIASITWASGGTVENVPANKTPAKVINLSFSVEAPCTPSLQQAIDDAIARGSVVVAAAGNSNQDAANFAPGNCNNVITVGAIDSNGDRANYSNFGEVIDISAPGGELDGQGIYSTSNEGTTTPTNSAYSVKQGTSIAAAYVSAAIAKLAQVNPTDDAVALRAKVLSKQSVRPFSAGKCLIDKNCGLGYLFFQISSHLRGGLVTAEYHPASSGHPEEVHIKGTMLARTDAPANFGSLVIYRVVSGSNSNITSECLITQTNATDTASNPLFSINESIYTVRKGSGTCFDTAGQYIFESSNGARISGISNTLSSSTVQFETSININRSTESSAPTFSAGYMYNIAYSSSLNYSTNMNGLGQGSTPVTYSLISSTSNGLGGYGASQIPCSDLNTSTGQFRINSSLCSGSDTIASKFGGGTKIYALKVKATDSNGQYSTRDVLLQFSTTSNNAPVFSASSPNPGPLTITPGTTQTITVSATDVDANVLDFTENLTRSWITEISTSSTGSGASRVYSKTYTLSPPVGTSETLQFEISVFDDDAFSLSTSIQYDIEAGGVLPPGTPGAPTLVPNGNGFLATFTAPTSGGSVTSYRADVTPTAGGSTIQVTCSAPPATTCDITGLSPETSYSVVIVAINSSGTASSSSTTGITSTSSAVVTPPSGGGGSITPTPIPSPTNSVRPNNLITNPLVIPTPNPTPTTTPNLVPGTTTAPEPLVRRLIQDLIAPLRPIIVDLFNNPTPQASAPGNTTNFDNQRALELTLNSTQDKKVVDLPSLVLVNNEYQPSKIVIVDNTSAQIITPGGGLLNVEAKDGQSSVPVDERGRVQMVRSNNVETEGSGMAPNSEFAVFLFSTPTLLGVGKTDAQGKFFASFPVDKTLPIGDHTLQVNGLLASGLSTSISMPVTVVEDIQTAKNQAMPKTILVDVNPVDKALKAMYWILIVLALMVFLIGFSYKDRFIALIRRRKDDEDPQPAI